MRGAVLTVLLLVPATGCTGEEPTGAQDPPKLGGTLPTQSPPSAPMDELEQPVAERLQQQVAGQGLTVDALDCPEWGGDVPAELTCEGWFDGVPGTVVVNLSRDKKQSVSFDAVLQDGVIATKRLATSSSRTVTPTSTAALHRRTPRSRARPSRAPSRRTEPRASSARR